MADRTGLSPSTIHDLLKVKYGPSSATCIKLADFFKVDPDVVLELAGHRPRRKEEELPDFHAYISRKFIGNPKLQRALVATYEAIQSALEEEERRIQESRRRIPPGRQKPEEGG